MIENYNVFKGIKQVFESTYTALTNSQKEGYLWFVRKDTATTVGDVYFGAKKYAEATDISIKADKSEAISALSLTMDSEYKLTLSGRTADGSGFTVSDVIDLPLETMVVSGAYDSANTQIVLTLKNGSTTSFPVSALVDGLQSEITSQNTLSADLISDGTTNKVVTGTDKTNWNNAYASAHTHANKSVLDNLTQTVIDNSHTHSNKSVLDDISSTDVDKWDAAIQGVRVNGVDVIPDTGNVIDINNVLAVTFVMTGDTIICDTTIDEIFNAIESGKYVYGTFSSFGNWILRPTLYYEDEDEKTVVFSVLLQIGSDDEITPFTIFGVINDDEDVWTPLNLDLAPIKANVIESILVNGTRQPVNNRKEVEITLDSLDITQHDYSQDYLTFTALENTTFTFSGNSLQYSINGGSTWTTLAANTASPYVVTGTKILWKQTGLVPGTGTTSGGIGKFSATGNFEASGNIMSLYYGDNFIGEKNLTGKDYAFFRLFESCNKLVNAENLILPATTLTDYCYYGMFSSCTKLTKAPELPATLLANNCYQEMFRVCTSLKSAPELPATALTSSCYRLMFSGCTNLNYIKCLATKISAIGCTTNWVNGVASTGTFVKADNMTSWTTWTTGNDGIPTGWNVSTESEWKEVKHYEISGVIASAHTHDNKSVLDDISSTDVDKWDAAIQGVRVNGVDVTPDTGNVIDITISEGEGGDDIDYSTQYLTFEAIEDTTFTFTRNPLQYSLDDGATWTNLPSDSHTPTVSAGNKILWKQGTTTPSIIQNYGMGTFSATGSFKAYGNVMSLCYGDNFIGEVSLSGKNYILQRLFRQNTYLVDSSNLVLPATTLANQCYGSMFSGCTSLTSAPKILPATSLTYYCYQEMFNGCTSLTSAPELPAPTLKMYSYSFMFNGCTSLSYIKCLATNISASNCTSNWVQNVSSTGVFIKADGMNGWTVGNNGIPTGWVDSTESEYGYARGYQIPKKTSDLTNDSGFITSDNISGKTDSTTFGTHSATTIANGTSSQMHLPTVSASDNNKVLMVVNGVWTLVAPSMIYSGSGAPDNSQGNNGDLYIQTS